ncbi:hypothetical protein FQA39_LY05430 [Lamprigera yunnana]|nr:hypothetical protein FQA39_LY05430 [Lamprigera yunnana]
MVVLDVIGLVYKSVNAVTFLDQTWQSIPDDEHESVPLMELKRRLTTNIDKDVNQIKESLLQLIWAIGENEDFNDNTTDEQLISEAVERKQQQEEDEHDDEENENGEAFRIKHCDAKKLSYPYQIYC